MAVSLAVAGDAFSGVLICAVFYPHEMFWISPGMSHFLRIFPTFFYVCFNWSSVMMGGW